LYLEKVERWRQAAQYATEKPVLTLKEQKELEKLRSQDQREIKALKKELQRKEKAMAEMAACRCCKKSGRPSARRTRKADQRSSRRKAIELISEACPTTIWLRGRAKQVDRSGGAELNPVAMRRAPGHACYSLCWSAIRPSRPLPCWNTFRSKSPIRTGVRSNAPCSGGCSIGRPCMARRLR
jgi:hypothetical protein